MTLRVRKNSIRRSLRMRIDTRRISLLGAIGLLAAAAFGQEHRPGADAAMVRIPGGTYTIGSETGGADERPAHPVALEPFWIDRFEVTNAEFLAFLESVLADAQRDIRLAGDAAPGSADARVIQGSGAGLFMEGLRTVNPPAFVALDDEQSRIGISGGRLFVEPGFEKHPVNEVTWYGARAFCVWRGARLPTEAEWEAAARGFEGRTYPWGDQPPTSDRAVFGRRSNQTGAVGGRPAGATPDGVHDLAGNVAEWTSTLYRPYPYRADDGREDPNADAERVTRGGDHVFDSQPEKLRGAFRAGFSRAIASGHRHIGFRCAR